MTAKTNAARQAAYRARREAEGLKRVPDIWARPENHAAIRDYAERIGRGPLLELTKDGIFATHKGVVTDLTMGFNQ